jgi:hypothetical protein
MAFQGRFIDRGQMDIRSALGLTNPTAIVGALAEAHEALGKAVARKQSAVRRWRDALLEGDLQESIAARAELGAAVVALERAEALIERLSLNLSSQSLRAAVPHPGTLREAP